MCGRYALYDISKLDFKIGNNIMAVSYNIAPSSIVPVVTENSEITLIKWTLRIPWSEKLRIVNARSETLETNLTFRNTKRCIFIANGYFEWLKRGGRKIPYYYTFDDRMMYFGGLFNDYGACIVTRQSYSTMAGGHHRQPVILRYQDFDSWFNSTHDYACEHSSDMDIFEVSIKVNSPKNNYPENITRVL